MQDIGIACSNTISATPVLIQFPAPLMVETVLVVDVI